MDDNIALTDEDITQVELEDVGGRAWWLALITTLTGQNGMATLRFFAEGPDRRYTSPTFLAPRSLGAVTPEEGWAPGMTSALETVRRELERDGWHVLGCGSMPWKFRYARPGRGAGPLSAVEEGLDRAGAATVEASGQPAHDSPGAQPRSISR
jgi:hypothetical protein